LGYNRIRDQGLKAISNAIETNTENKLVSLALKYNFISDDGFDNLISKISKSKINTLFMKKNNLTNYYLPKHKENCLKIYKNFYVDSFEKLDLQEEERLARTIWVHPGTISAPQLRSFFESSKRAGIVLNIR
jgi:hypothetical protein